MLVRDAINEYLKAKSGRARVNTFNGYVSAIQAHILPRWGNYELEDITHAELQQLSWRGIWNAICLFPTNKNQPPNCWCLCLFLRCT